MIIRNCFIKESIDYNLLTVELGPFRHSIETHWFTFYGLVDTFVSNLSLELIDGVVNNQANPRRSKHVVHKIVLMEAPIVAHFADLVSLQIIVVIH